jgi:hypothetical protein
MHCRMKTKPAWHSPCKFLLDECTCSTRRLRCAVHVHIIHSGNQMLFRLQRTPNMQSQSKITHLALSVRSNALQWALRFIKRPFSEIWTLLSISAAHACRAIGQTRSPPAEVRSVELRPAPATTPASCCVSHASSGPRGLGLLSSTHCSALLGQYQG